MGMIDRSRTARSTSATSTPWAPRGHVAGIAQSGSVTDAFIHFGTRIGFSRIIGAGSEVVLDVCDYLAYCLDDPETTRSSCSSRASSGPSGSSPWPTGRSSWASRSWPSRSAGATQAQAAAVAHSGSLAGETRATDAALAAAGVVRCTDLDALFEAAELLAGCRRTGRRVGRGRTGVVTVSTGEASLIADLAERTGPTCRRCPSAARSGDPRGAADARLHRQSDRSVGRATRGSPTRPCSRRSPPRARYDVLALVHDFPYRSLPSEVDTAERGRVRAPGRDRRPTRRSCRSTSR